MALANVLLSALWRELLIGAVGLVAGAVFATFWPRLAATQRQAGDWIPLRWKRVALAVHGAFIIREVWRYKQPGTCRAIYAATRRWLAGKGFHLQIPTHVVVPKVVVDDDAAFPSPTPVPDNWYVGEKDLTFFKYHVEQNGPVPGASAWEVMMEKDIPNVVRYTAWRRTLPCGKTEYKSVTLCPDATAQEFNDLYFDDDFRVNWDEMVIHHEVLEHGDFPSRQQVVRWIRRFPFAFLSDREYSIARRSYRIDGAFYGLTKAIDHPRAPATGKVVHMDVFHSMWKSYDVECPWGSGKPACETVLLHHEQFKIPENLARFAVRIGMWRFVKKMSEEVPKFIAARRARADPNEVDTQAYGSGYTANPPMRRRMTGITDSSCTLSSMASGSRMSLSDMDSASGGGGGNWFGNDDESEHERSSASTQPLRAESCKAYVPRGNALGRLKGVAVLALVGSVALIARSRHSGAAGASAGGAAAVARPSRRGGAWRRRGGVEAVIHEEIVGRAN